MDHNDIRHKLSEYLDGSVSSHEKAEIEAHLKTCPECNNALNELRKTIEQIKAIEEIEPPAWMKQKIMAKVRAEAEQKKSTFERLFFPLTIKLPIPAVATVFLAVIAFYIYQSIQPTAKYTEAPSPTTHEFVSKQEAAPAATSKRESHVADDAPPPSKQLSPAPRYPTPDIKKEYEKPSSSAPQDQFAASAPSRPGEQAASEKKEMTLERPSPAPHALAKVEMQEQAASAAGAAAPTKTKSEPIASLKMAKKSADKTEPGRRLERDIVERHPNGKPKLVITYEIVDARMITRAEERFNSNGERHGIQKEYYLSGQLKTEAQYGEGKLEWYQEYGPDGVKKIGKTNYDWFWLKK